jgi:hypothetical protein|tara:strand:+ start:240 stop:611 length:372 start_codon:yes stop_codon:yes gene_type:complete
MNKFLRSSLLSLLAVVLAVIPALAQDEQTPENLEKLAGVYEFEAPDYGVISVTIGVTEEKELTISAMGAVPTAMKHVEGNLWELQSPDWGLLNIGFVEEDDGSISAITIDSYSFSFVAFKKKQ